MEDFAPKNRRSVSLGILEIEIESKEGIHNTDPNGAAQMACLGDYPNLTPIDGLKSEISGKPSVKIRFDDIELALAFEEMDRLFRRQLRRKEVLYLIKKYGMFHEVHDDFYDELGYAYQPIPISEETKKRKEYLKQVEIARKQARKLERELKANQVKEKKNKV